MADAETSAGESRTPRLIFVDAAPFFGGAQHSLLSILEGLNKRISASAVLVSADVTPDGLCQRAALFSNIDVKPFHCRHWGGSLRGVWQMITDIRHFASLAAAQENGLRTGGVVYANGWRSALLWRFSRLHALPCVLQDRDMRVPGLIVRFLSRGLVGIIGASQAVLEKWREHFAEQRLHEIPLGFPVPDASSTKPEDTPHLKLALVGDFVRWKNHVLLLQALELLQRQDVAVSAHILGRCHTPESKGLVDDLRRFIREHGLKKVRIDADGGDGLQAMTAADVVVSCALSESFGRTVIEALSLGRPVVAVAAGAIPEVLGGCEAATLCDAFPEAMAAAIVQWHSAEKRAAAATAARRFAARYSLQAMADKTLKVLGLEMRGCPDKGCLVDARATCCRP